MTFNGTIIEAFAGDSRAFLVGLWAIGREAPEAAREFRRLRVLERRLKAEDPDWHRALTETAPPMLVPKQTW